MGDVLVVPATDERVAAHLADGWTVVAESWGARLDVADVDRERLTALVETVLADGVAVVELDQTAAPEVWAVQEATHTDFPVTPATPAPEASAADIAGLWSSGWRVFGARVGGALVGATLIHPIASAAASADTEPVGDHPTYAETGWTAVLAAHRGRGVARALKAASVLALIGEGIQRFGTGGAGQNAASLAMNAAVGYRVTERWVTLARPSANLPS